MIDFVSLLTADKQQEIEDTKEETERTITYIEKELYQGRADEIMKRLKCEEEVLSLNLTEACRKEIQALYEQDKKAFWDIAEELDKLTKIIKK